MIAPGATLPLTKRRRDFLEDLAAGQPVRWASTVTQWWARDAGLTEPVAYPTDLTGTLTDLGRRALVVDEEHRLVLSSKVLASATAGRAASTGSIGRCRCGERWQNDEAPTKGGHRQITALHREHVNAQLLKNA